MEIIEGKYLAYDRGTSKDVYKCYEDYYPKGNLSVLKTIWFLITSKRYKYYLSETIKYAIIHHNCYRGDKSSDVAIFTGMIKGYRKMWKKVEQAK